MPSTYILEDDNISVLYIVFQISPEMTVKSFSVWGTRVREKLEVMQLSERLGGNIELAIKQLAESKKQKK